MSDVINELVTEMQEAAIAERRSLAEQFRSLLAKPDKLGRKDVTTLQGLVNRLQVAPKDIPDLAEVARELDRSEYLAGTIEDLKRQQGEANKALGELSTWQAESHARVDKEAEEKREPLSRQYGHVNGQLREAEEARSQLINLQARWLAFVEETSVEDARDQLIASRRDIPHDAMPVNEPA